MSNKEARYNIWAYDSDGVGDAKDYNFAVTKRELITLIEGFLVEHAMVVVKKAEVPKQ